ncbi:MAG: caspase family protein [Candidatus Polarisedimenticolia bacterium]
MVRGIVVSLALLSCPSFVAATNYALLIGTNSYQNVDQISGLTYPQNDVETLKAVLERQSYIVKDLVDHQASREWIIRELRRLAMTVKKNDVFLLSFAGHGVRNEPMNKETYWLTYDARLDAIDVAGIRLGHLLDYVQDIPAERKLILLDHCYSGNITLGGGGGGGEGTRGGAGTHDLDMRGQTLEVSLPAKGSPRSAGLVVLAASYGIAFESRKWEHGIFTKAVLEALDEFKADRGAPVGHGDGDGKVSVQELISYVEMRVPLLAKDLNISQSIVPKLESAEGLSAWFVAENARGLAGEIIQFAAFKATLRDWALQGLITSNVLTRCNSILDAAEESVRTSVTLEPEKESKYRLIRDTMLSDERKESRASTLKLLFDPQ